MGLTEEQKRRIEENRLKALAKRRQGAINVQPSPGSVSKAQINSVPFVGSSTPVATRPPTSSVNPSTAIEPITGMLLPKKYYACINKIRNSKVIPRTPEPGASFTKLTCVSDVTLGNFLL